MQRKVKFNNATALRKRLVIVVMVVSFFGGIFMAVKATDEIKNYLHPYSFAFLSGLVGFMVAFYTAKLLKPYLALNRTMLLNYFRVTVMFSVGFVGGFILLASYLNSKTSRLAKCDEFPVVDTHYSEGGRRRLEANILYVNVDGNTEKLLCSHSYWNKIIIGSQVKVCLYQSPVGFDYFVLADDH